MIHQRFLKTVRCFETSWGCCTHDPHKRKNECEKKATFLNETFQFSFVYARFFTLFGVPRVVWAPISADLHRGPVVHSECCIDGWSVAATRVNYSFALFH